MPPLSHTNCASEGTKTWLSLIWCKHAGSKLKFALLIWLWVTFSWKVSAVGKLKPWQHGISIRKMPWTRCILRTNSSLFSGEFEHFHIFHTFWCGDSIRAGCQRCVRGSRFLDCVFAAVWASIWLHINSSHLPYCLLLSKLCNWILIRLTWAQEIRGHQ